MNISRGVQNMKNIILSCLTSSRCSLLGAACLLAIAVTGCGGGGGDGDSVSSTCRSYCSFTCARAANCGFYPSSQIESCDDSCVETIESNGTSAAECDSAGERLAGVSCAQLGSILGLRRAEFKSLSSEVDEQKGRGLAEHTGAECAVSINE